MQFAVGVGLLLTGFGGNVNQRLLLRAAFQVAVHRVMAQIGEAADEPSGKGRSAVVQHPVERLVPVD